MRVIPSAVLSLFTACVGSSDFLSEYRLSCFKSTSVAEEELGYCSFVDWQSGKLFDPGVVDFSVFSPGDPLSRSEQDGVASELSKDMLGSTSYSDECKQAAKRFACVSVFPLCPEPGTSLSSYSYFPACKIQCEQVNRACEKIVADCSGLREEGNCMIHIPDERFLLNPALGPYSSISTIYMTFFAIWTLLTILWIYLSFVRYNTETYSHNGPLLLSKISIPVPVIRIIVLGISIFFWRSCYSAGDMCERIYTTPLFSMHHIAESAQMLMFLVVARGWGYTRVSLTVETWRSMFCVIFSFYLVSSVVASINLQPPSLEWTLYTSILYGFMYSMIVHYTLTEMGMLYAQVKKFSPHMPALATAPLQEKYYTYVAYLFIVLGIILLEIVCQYLYASQSAPFWEVILTYELCSLLLFLALGVLFRPRTLSPFFYMTPTTLEASSQLNPRGENVEMRRRLQQARAQRPTPIVEISTAQKQQQRGASNADDEDAGLLTAPADTIENSAAVLSQTVLQPSEIPVVKELEINASTCVDEFDLTPLLLNCYIANDDDASQAALADNTSILSTLRDLGLQNSGTDDGNRPLPAEERAGPAVAADGDLEMRVLDRQRAHQQRQAPSTIGDALRSAIPGLQRRTGGDQQQQPAHTLRGGNGDRVRIISVQGPDMQLRIAVQRTPSILPAAGRRGGGAVAGAYSVDQFPEFLRSIFRFRPIWRTRTMVVPSG